MARLTVSQTIGCLQTGQARQSVTLDKSLLRHGLALACLVDAAAYPAAQPLHVSTGHNAGCAGNDGNAGDTRVLACVLVPCTAGTSTSTSTSPGGPAGRGFYTLVRLPYRSGSTPYDGCITVARVVAMYVL